MKDGGERISIISINYKQAEVSNKMLESLQKVSYKNFEIIIVDNNSGEDDVKKLNLNYPGLKLIRSKRNLGFAGGNNLGIKEATGDYILLLNNDTEVDPGFLEPMLEAFGKHKNAGALSPKIKFFDDPKTIQYAGFGGMNPFTQRMKTIGNHQEDNGDYDMFTETPFAHGCAMMLPRSVIDEVGMMCEDYFLYYEEHDWSENIKRAGYKIYYQPASVVYHKESMSVQKGSSLKTYYLNRNRILFMKRNYGLLTKLLAIPYLALVSIPKNIITFAIKKEKEHLSAYLDAISWNITGHTKPRWQTGLH